ncbi:MAG: hypothetical protein LBJ35_06320 [Spirochaetaceae bacterium]|jgi:hypothetical protein|nr:hypothetical protein [Spirochaetaceae bacterium]
MNIFNLFSNEKKNAALQEMTTSFARRNDELQKESLALRIKLCELIAEDQKNEQLVAKTITNAVERLESVKTDFNNTAQLIKESSDNLLRLEPNTKLKVGAVNKMARELDALRTIILDALHGGDNTVIERLNSISEALESNITKTFSTIDVTLKENAEKLFESYERFFELCKNMSGDEDSDEKEAK